MSLIRKVLSCLHLLSNGLARGSRNPLSQVQEKGLVLCNKIATSVACCYSPLSICLTVKLWLPCLILLCWPGWPWTYSFEHCLCFPDVDWQILTCPSYVSSLCSSLRLFFLNRHIHTHQTHTTPFVGEQTYRSQLPSFIRLNGPSWHFLLWVYCRNSHPVCPKAAFQSLLQPHHQTWSAWFLKQSL